MNVGINLIVVIATVAASVGRKQSAVTKDAHCDRDKELTAPKQKPSAFKVEIQ